MQVAQTSGSKEMTLFAQAQEVKVAVIIPTYQQPLLLEEAVQGALRQETDFNYAVLVINDGCPMEETHRVGMLYAQRYPERIYYFAKRNAGLSAARNSGIEHALALFPALEAVYFLDSDNRIQPHALQCHYNRLTQAGEGIGWAYPDIQKIGIASYCDTSGRYNPLEHLVRNISEAGSMVSRRMLDAGVRFDTSMKMGYEDWEFWLQSLHLGFQGVHVPASGFQYRYRPESMLSGSRRHHEKIMEYIYSKHAALFSPQALLAKEAKFAPRYGVWLSDTDTVLHFSVLEAECRVHTHDAFMNILAKGAVEANYGDTPAFLVIMPQRVWDWITLVPVSVASVLWQMEILASEALYTTLVLEENSENASLTGTRILPPRFVHFESKDDPPMEGAHAVMINTKHMRHALDMIETTAKPVTPNSLITPWCLKTYGEVVLCSGIQGITPPRPLPVSAVMLEIMTRWKELDEQFGTRMFKNSLPDIHRTVIAMPRDYFFPAYQVESCFPLSAQAEERVIAVAVPAGDVALLPALYDLLYECRARQVQVHLFLIGNTGIAAPLLEDGPFTAVHIVAERVIPEVNTHGRELVKSYFGAPAYALRKHEELWLQSMWLPFHAVLNINAWQVDTVAGALRKHGVRMLHCSLQDTLSEQDLARLSAYEPAYDRIVLGGADAADQLYGVGVPAGRVCTLDTWQTGSHDVGGSQWHRVATWILEGV